MLRDDRIEGHDPPKRHAVHTPVLTANVYTVLGRDDDRRAIEKLPDVGTVPEAQRVRATGTDSATAGSAPPCRLRAPGDQASVGESPPASPSDPRFSELVAAWGRLDEHARGAVPATSASERPLRRRGGE